MHEQNHQPKEEKQFVNDHVPNGNESSSAEELCKIKWSIVDETLRGWTKAAV